MASDEAQPDHRRRGLAAMRTNWRIAAALLLVFAASTASANGRAPITNGINFRPGDPQSIYLRTTFGLLISNDDGCTFHWVCEQNVGYGGTFDPKYAIAADGTIFATTFTGLRVSRDGGCNFATATSELPAGSPGRIADMWVDSIDIGPTGEVWVGTAETGKPNDVYRSTDNGLTFEARNMMSQTVWWKSIKVAPSDPMRIYVGGYELSGGSTPIVHLFRSVDAGAQWTALPLTGVVLGAAPTLHVLAVAPNDPDVLLVRSLQASPPTGDRLYRSTNGGMTFTEVLATTDEIRDVLFVDNNQVIVASPTGSFRSTDAGATFSPLSGSPKLGCLGRRSDGSVMGCGANWQPDFMALTKTADVASWTKVFRFVEMAGPLHCPAGSGEADICGPMWGAMAQQFATTGPRCGPEAVPDGPPDAPTTTPPGNGGCCDSGSGSAGLLWFLFVGAWIGRKRERR